MTRGALVLAIVLALGGSARGDTLTVGLFAPAAPFPSTAARVDLATALGDHAGEALGQRATGKVFARASDFTAAVRKGEVAVALVDPAFLAGSSGYTVIAAAVRDGRTEHGWQIVARGTAKLAGLAGKRVLVPSIGGRETALVLDVLLAGEAGKDFFAAIDAAPDTASALAALGLGKADAVVVPAGVALPAGTTVVATLPALLGPVVVTYGGITATQRQALAAALASFQGDATVSGFRAADADAVNRVARRFVVPVKRGPLAVPAIRLVVGDLVEGRTFTIERTPASAFAAKPR